MPLWIPCPPPSTSPMQKRWNKWNWSRKSSMLWGILESRSKRRSWTTAVTSPNAATGEWWWKHTCCTRKKWNYSNIFVLLRYLIKCHVPVNHSFHPNYSSVCDCCSAFLLRKHWCTFFDMHALRCCVTETIPISYLEQVRSKYLNYDTRAQYKDLFLRCTDTCSN